MEINNVYDESQIQVLEGLEAVSKRPGMYIGTTSSRGLHHLVYEIVDNSIDEALAGRCDYVEISILKGEIIKVRDNGAGIPTGIHEKMGIPTVEVVHTILHAGGKFGGGGYKVSGGLHGVGASVVNALSVSLRVESARDGSVWAQEYSRGMPTTSVRKLGPQGDRKGTTTTFLADPEVFETVEFSFDTIAQRLRESAYLN